MNAEMSHKQNLLYRMLLAFALILLAAALRIAPHPWNFTPVGAMALFAGAMLRDRRLAIPERLSAYRFRPRRLLHRRHSVLLEHSGGRRILCRIAVRQLRLCRAYASRPAPGFTEN